MEHSSQINQAAIPICGKSKESEPEKAPFRTHFLIKNPAKRSNNSISPLAHKNTQKPSLSAQKPHQAASTKVKVSVPKEQSRKYTTTTIKNPTNTKSETVRHHKMTVN